MAILDYLFGTMDAWVELGGTERYVCVVPELYRNATSFSRKVQNVCQSLLGWCCVVPSAISV